MSVMKLLQCSKMAPNISLFALLLTLFLSASIAQEYLSKCDVNSEAPCARDKFLSCLSSICQCEDSLNQVFDPVLNSCAIMAGRKCSGILSSAELLDPRRLVDAVKTFPTCGANAVCDGDTSSCTCTPGYFHNETDGTCQLSFGMQCSKRDIIVFQNSPNSGKQTNQTTPATTFLSCDTSLGLVCGTEGFCVCEGNSVWKLNTGCVPFNESSNTPPLRIFDNINTNSGKFLNPDYTYGYHNGDDEQTPISKLIDAYTKAMLEANNYYYLNQNNAELMGGNPTRENSTKDNVLGERNQFPGNGANNGVNSNSIQINQNDQLWNYLMQQDQNSNNNFRVPITNNQGNIYNASVDDPLQLKDQILQLQRLLEQQKQLEAAVNTLFSTTNKPAQQQNFVNQGTPNFLFPSSLMALSHHLLGIGAQNLGQFNGNGVQYQQPSLFGGPLFRYFRSLIDPFKRRFFPNWGDSPYTFPSPIYIVAATIRSILPVLRAFDQQFTPLLENVVQLTKPRPRTTPAPQVPIPVAYNQNSQFTQQQQQQQSWLNNRLQGYNNQQGQPNLLGQRLFPGNGLFGLTGLNRARSVSFNNLGPTDTENRRNARMRQFNDNGNQQKRVNRGVFWWG